MAARTNPDFAVRYSAGSHAAASNLQRVERRDDVITDTVAKPMA
jgi:hypothetical protein